MISNSSQYVAAGVIGVTVGGVPVPASLISTATLQAIDIFNVSFEVPLGLVGNQPVVFTVDGIAGPAATIQLTGSPSGLSVVSPSNLGTYSLGEVQLGLQASGGNGSYSWTLESGSLPPGLTIRGDLPFYAVPFAPVGLIGVATTAGTYNFTLAVTSGSASTTASFSMKITGLTLKDGPTLRDAFAGVAYYSRGYQLTATSDGAVQNISCTPQTTAGLTLGSSCLISGTPTTAGPLSIPVTSSNGVDAVTRNVSLTVYSVQIIDPGQLPNAFQKQAYTYTLTPAGNGPFSYLLAGTLPDGLTLTGGTISGTPADVLGKSNFTITVVDAHGNSYTKAMSIDVAGTPETLPRIAPYANYADCPVGMGCSNAIAVSAGGVAPFTWTVTGLPLGMDYRFGGGKTLGFVNAGDLELWGAPSEIGVFDVTVTAIDANGVTVTQIFQIFVDNMLFDPCMNEAGCSPLTDATLGRTYATSIRVVGGVPPYTAFSASGYSLSDEIPEGLWVTPTAITGTPQENGLFTSVLDLRDSANNALAATMPLTIFGPSGSTTAIDVYPELRPVAGQPFSLQLEACCATGSYIWTPSFLQLGLTLSSSGSIAGTPTLVGTSFVLLTATDSANANNYGTREVIIATSSISIATNTLPDGNANVSYNQAVSGTGNGALRWGIAYGSFLPPGLGLNTTTGVISGVPRYSGGYSFYVTAFDSDSATTEAVTMSVYTLCDITKAGVTSTADVRQLVDEALGKQPALDDLNADHEVNVVDVAIGANAAMQLGCSAH
ncbi:MAG TPA: putative Ig domain-containing protein [Bryobacteraceae bacterium]|nr:putative Ig domain-containing protein [Bryobacteraceae bacterium]